MKQTSAGASDPTFTIGGISSDPVSVFSPKSFGMTLSNLVTLQITADKDAAFDNFDFTINSTPVPEPASAAFLGLGSLALVVRRLRRRNSVVA